MILGGLERDRPHEMGLKRNIEENRLIELTDRLQILLKQIWMNQLASISPEIIRKPMVSWWLQGK